MRNAWRLLIGAIGTMAVTMGATTAGHATTYYFTESGSANTPALAAPGYGTAAVTTVGSDLEFQITLTSGWFVDTGTSTNHQPVEFRLTTSGLPISGTPVVASALPSPFTQASGNSFTNPSFNTPMNYALSCPANGADGCNNVSSLTFYVLGAGALALQLTDGVYITADIYNPNSPIANNYTGTIGATLAGEAPLPAAVWMFGSVLAGAAGAARYRRRKKAVATLTA